MKPIKATKKRQKNFFPTFILILVFWTITGWLIGFVEPELVKNILIHNSYLVFFIPLSLALFFTASVLLTNSRRGFLAAFVIVGFLILRLHDLGNVLNLALLAGLAIAVEYYFTQKR